MVNSSNVEFKIRASYDMEADKAHHLEFTWEVDKLENENLYFNLTWSDFSYISKEFKQD